jgi:O-antigen ligase
MLCLAFSLCLIAGPKKIFFWRKNYPRLMATGLFFAICILGSLLCWKFSHTHNLNGEILPPGETTRRFYWWVSGLRMLYDFPFFGVGLGNFASAYQAYKYGLVQNTLYPHNFLIGLLAEIGIIGTVALFSFVFHVLTHANLHRTLEEKWPYLIGLVSFMIFGLIGLSLEYLVNVLSCALLLGLIASPPGKPRIKLPRSAQMIVIGAAVFVLPFLLAPLMSSRACVEGQRLLSQGRSHEAIDLFASAAQLDPRSSSAHHGWAQALSRTGSPSVHPEIILHLTRAIQLDRLNLPLQNELQRYSDSH